MQQEASNLMTDYGHDLLFGTFITPTAMPATHAVDLAIASEQAGLDLVTFQDHPYQAAFHETWTLISYAASRTERIRLAGNVLNLPLRNPVVLARSIASLDLLSDGRVELGIGTGAFWDAIAAMGGPRRTPGESITALREAIAIAREVWDTSKSGGIWLDGEIYQIQGAKRGPAPAHDVDIWVGAYKPRMLALVGQLADGWLPSLGYLPGGPSDLAQMNARIDKAAEAAGRDPRAIRRMLNINGQFSSTSRGFLNGPPSEWAEQIADTAIDYGISAFILAADDAQTIALFATEVVPRARAIVADRRVLRSEILAAQLSASGGLSR